MSDTLDKVRKLVSSHLNVPVEQVTETADFVDDLGADSLDQVELVMALEEEFSIEISDEDVTRTLNVADAVKLITKLQA